MTITETPPKTQPPTLVDAITKNDNVYRQWRDDVAAELQTRKHYDDAERWDYCDNSPRYKISRHKADLPPSTTTVWVCSASSEHDAVLFSASCDFRICPDCAHRHTARLLNRYVPAIEKEMAAHPKYRLRTIMLTRSVQLGSEGFAKAATEGFNLIQKLMYSVVGPDWNKKGAGLLANWEVGPNGHKLHYHMVYLGPWVAHKKLSEAWEKLTGGDKVVWITAVKHNDGDWQGAVIETLKYATKFYSENKATGERIYLSPKLTVDLFEAMKGTRRIRSWGSFYHLEEQKERVFCCEQCDSKMERIGVNYYEIWRETGFTKEGWKSAIRGSLLQYRIADKYTPITGEEDNSHPMSTRLLPFMDEVPIKNTLHYDHE